MENKEKFALYCRVSTTMQTTDNQKIRLLQWATDNNYRYELFDETQTTRKTRPIKQLLLQRLRKGDFTAVVVFKLDRWARSSTELILETKELIDKGIGFISLSDNLDFTSASGKLHFQILSAFAEFERALISCIIGKPDCERTKEGLHRVKQSGTILGRPKGAKDKKKRVRSGYYVREMRKRGEL